VTSYKRGRAIEFVNKRAESIMGQCKTFELEDLALSIQSSLYMMKCRLKPKATTKTAKPVTPPNTELLAELGLIVAVEPAAVKPEVVVPLPVGLAGVPVKETPVIVAGDEAPDWLVELPCDVPPICATWIICFSLGFRIHR
jgi:hypothetical protein